MASGPINEGGSDVPIEKKKFLGIKVYTRRVFRKRRNATSIVTSTATTIVDEVLKSTVENHPEVTFTSVVTVNNNENNINTETTTDAGENIATVDISKANCDEVEDDDRGNDVGILDNGISKVKSNDVEEDGTGNDVIIVDSDASKPNGNDVVEDNNGNDDVIIADIDVGKANGKDVEEGDNGIDAIIVDNDASEHNGNDAEEDNNDNDVIIVDDDAIKANGNDVEEDNNDNDDVMIVDNDASKAYSNDVKEDDTGKDLEANGENENNLVQVPPEDVGNVSLAEQQVISLSNDGSDDLSSPREHTAFPSTMDSELRNGMVKHVLEDNEIMASRSNHDIMASRSNHDIMASRSKYDIMASRSKHEIMELRRKLESELDTVRSMARKLEVTENGVVGFTRFYPNEMTANKLRRVQSEVGVPRQNFSQSRALNQLSVSVTENTMINEYMEKEKRTPKANQFYRNSEFLLAKDKFPPENNRKTKSGGKKQDGGHGLGFASNSKFLRRCSVLLDKLMKHKHGWVFNAPVDVKALGLHDYFIIITHPMDLGTIKTRVNTNWYKSPKEFAEDVRLTFHNAMTYNPKGQDVHIMAEQLLNMFEEKWAPVEMDYDREIRLSTLYDMSLQTPTSRKTSSMPMPAHLDMRRIFDRSESITHSFDSRPRSMSITPSGRTPAAKKPKAKDIHKREMTYEEKQKLSTNLSNLPTEKLEAVVEIMKRRNSALCQRDDEIEVEIDSVDTETLWELDRFVTNYKKSLSKKKRRAEIALQARVEAERKIQKIPDQIMVEAPREETTVERNTSLSCSVQMENLGDKNSGSSSSSSSSSDSGSSSDSDSDSSSSGSDGGRSQ
ncbi:hypothetical protein ACFE04_017327 [Oxalis oulophora]